MARFWTCPKCKASWPKRFTLCQTIDCTGRRRPTRPPKHQQVLEMPYDWWVERFGERCGVCGRPAGPTRRLDRDHDHQTGEPRGLLCHRCNRALANWVDIDWLRRAIRYLTPNCKRCGGKYGEGGHGPGLCIDRRETDGVGQ